MDYSKIKIANKTYTGSDLLVARKMISLESSAASRGFEFNLSFETVKELMAEPRCFYTGLRMNDVSGSSTQRTIDRLDNSQGYIEGNVVACIQDINSKKGNLTLQEIELLYRRTREPKNLFSWIRSFFS